MNENTKLRKHLISLYLIVAMANIATTTPLAPAMIFEEFIEDFLIFYVITLIISFILYIFYKIKKQSLPKIASYM